MPVLFARNQADAVIAMAVNVPCPSQEVESRRHIYRGHFEMSAGRRLSQPDFMAVAGRWKMPSAYLPTERAVRDDHYSAIVHRSLVGPDGVLVERIVALIDSLWSDSE